MQIVINIPEEEYKIIKNYTAPMTWAERLIKNGMPLPKNHGRLIDVDKVISNGISKGFCNWYDEMKYAPTIVEADITESEDKDKE